MDMVRQMDMSYSYKPILMKAILRHADNKGRVNLSELVTYFRVFFKNRRENGLIVEKAKSVYLNPDITDKEILHNILINPFKRFEDMDVLHHTKTLGIIEVDSTIWKHLDKDDKSEIEQISNKKLEEYYRKIK